MEKLHIQRFAGMNDVGLDIARFNVFIGPQAAGKSVCAKLLYFFKDLPAEMASAIVDDQGPKELQQRLVAKFESFFPSAFLGTADFRVTYTTDGAEMVVERSDANSGGLTIHFAQPILDEFEKAISYHKNMLKAALQEEMNMDLNDAKTRVQKRFYEAIENAANPGISKFQYFIPAGRSFFATVERSIFGLFRNNESIDPFLMEFGAHYEKVKSRPQLYASAGIEPPSAKPEVNALARQVLSGEHLRVDGKDYLRLADGRIIAIAFASSGQQEALPLTLILQDAVVASYMTEGATLYIEEPEAHLFPSTQHAIVQLAANVFNVARSDLQFVITTHSPYILTGFNNLLQAGQIVQSINGDAANAVYDIVPKEQILHAKDFRCYLLHDGRAESLMDPDSGLINADAIDHASDELAAQFYKLMEVADL